MDPLPPKPYSPADLEFAAELLNRGEPLEVAREKLTERGLSPDAATLLFREFLFGAEAVEEEKAPRRVDLWCLIGGGVILALGLVLLVLGTTGVFPNESSVLDGVKLTLVGLMVLAYGVYR